MAAITISGTAARTISAILELMISMKIADEVRRALLPQRVPSTW